MSKTKSKDNRKSLCEESMLVFVNILKLSSLSLARTTLLKTPPNNNNQTSSPTQKTEIEKTGYYHTSKQQRSKRSQKPEQAKSSKYVILPDHNDISTTLSPKYREIANVDGHFSDYIRRFHEKTENDHENAIVEGKVESFIKRFHEKNIVDLNNESRRRNYVLPPPPRYTFK